MKEHTVRLMIVLAMVWLAGHVTVLAADEATGIDLTKALPPAMNNVHNLGPTGLQGWMLVEQQRLVPGDMTLAPLTVNARQIYITAVDEGSPADGVIQVGDVLLGIGEELFDGDPRVALADAINEAETRENGGILKLLCWRPDEPDEEGAVQRPSGSTQVREVRLKVLGTFSETAPYNCEKSEAILKQTVDAMLSRMNTTMDLFHLALLATGEEEQVEIVKSHVRRIAASAPEPSLESVEKAHAWNTGYRLVLLCEYYLLTQDEAVLPAIRNIAITLSMGQSIGGMWGHRMAQPSYNDGRLHGRIEGYAALNQPSLICFMGLALARKCGVTDPELATALDKAGDYFRHYTGTGAIPYGFHPPKEYMQSNNGTSGSAALAFAIQGDKEPARFFSVMSAGAAAKLEVGHTGPFFNTLWTGLGANVAGPEAYAEFFKRWTWRRTLTRRWNGGFVYEQPNGGSFSYRGLSSDAAMVLHFALPRRKLLITGRTQDESLWLKGKDAVAAASVWDIDYEASPDHALLAMLDHEIPMVRGFAALELAKRGEEHLDPLRRLLKGSDNQRIGACNALAAMKEHAAPAVPALMELARDDAANPWIRSRAVRAIAATGAAGPSHRTELLGLLMQDRDDDPRRDFERYAASFVLHVARQPSFDAASHIDSIHPAALRLMGHPHSTARAAGVSMVENVCLKDFHLVADRMVDVIRNDNPEYTSYSGDQPRAIGLGVLERLDIEDGIQLAIESIEPGKWGYWARVKNRLALLKKYGAAVKPYLPELRASLRDRDKDDPALEEIEHSTLSRTLITLEEARQAGNGG